MDPKSSGILLHPISLPNQHAIGDLGMGAYQFVDFLHHSNQQWWQMLPIGLTGAEHSPYDGTSAFAGNPLLINPERLIEQGFLTIKDIKFTTKYPVDNIHYATAIQTKNALLKKAFQRFKSHKKPSQFDEFVCNEAYWLNDFSLFSALQMKEKTAHWTHWSNDLKYREPQVLHHAKSQLADEILYYQFIQWQFSLQWNELKAYCHQQGIKLIGDIPLFVAHQSADVWSHPEFFKLDAHLDPLVVAGVPPDYFSKTGQFWNVPVYCWEQLKNQDYSWWIDRVRINLQRFDLIRMDHFIGFIHTYEIAANETTAECGHYAPGGGTDFFDALYKSTGKLPLIAEDLGEKTPEVDALRDAYQIPGMRILQFELEASLNGHFVSEDNYPKNAVIYTGTHDNNTIMGWFQQLSEFQRKQLKITCTIGNEPLNWALIRKAYETEAQIAIIPMQDILGLNAKARMNTPGSPYNNWQWRLKKDAITEEHVRKLCDLTKTYGRDAPLN